MILRQTTLLTLLSLLLSNLPPSLAQEDTKAPSTSTLSATSTVSYFPTVPTLQSKDDPEKGAGCLPRFHDCAVIGREDLCCELEQVCIADNFNNVACCPYGSVCAPVGEEKSTAWSARGSEGLMVAVGVGSIAWGLGA